jgi:hypothetical protein
MTGRATVRSIAGDEWAELAVRFADRNYRQFPPYVEKGAAAVGAACEFAAIEREGRLLGLASLRIKSLPVLGAGIAYLNGGPLVRQTEDPAGCGEGYLTAIDALVDDYVRRRGHLLRVVLPVSAEPPRVDHPMAEEIDAGRKLRGRRRYRTILVDLEGDEDRVRARFHQKWRNALRKAERSALEIVSGTSPDLFDAFEPMFRALKERKGFSVDQEPSFFKAVQAGLGFRDRFVVHLARYDGEVVSGHIGSYCGDTAVYLFGATTEEGHRMNASYLLQWEAMRKARALGCTLYDLGGIDPDGNPGVYRFKQRMGGREAEAVGPIDFAPPVRRWLLHQAEEAYGFLRERGPQKTRVAVPTI